MPRSTRVSIDVRGTYRTEKRHIQTILVAAAVTLLMAGAPAMAQLDPDDLADTVAFLSMANFNGQPTLVAEPGFLNTALDHLQAIPHGAQFKTSYLGPEIAFDIAPMANVAALLSVLCEDPERYEDPCPDIASITYNDRACFQDSGVSVTEHCTLQSDGSYVKKWDPVKNRCRLEAPGNQCTEIRVIGWHEQYFADSCCTLEIKGRHVEKTSLRCKLCS